MNDVETVAGTLLTAKA